MHERNNRNITKWIIPNSIIYKYKYIKYIININIDI